MLKCMSIAQARTKCVPAFWAQSGPRHFTCKFLYKVALVTWWHAFWPRRLAQSGCLRSGLTLGRGIFPVNVRIKWLLQNVEVHCDPAVSHNVVLGSGPRHFSCKFLYEVALVTCWSVFRLGLGIGPPPQHLSQGSPIKQPVWPNIGATWPQNKAKKGFPWGSLCLFGWGRSEPWRKICLKQGSPNQFLAAHLAQHRRSIGAAWPQNRPKKASHQGFALFRIALVLPCVKAFVWKSACV